MRAGMEDETSSPKYFRCPKRGDRPVLENQSSSKRNRDDARGRWSLHLYLKCDVLRGEVSPALSSWAGIEGLFTRFSAWLRRRMPNERQRLLALTIVAGGLCGLAAVAFHFACFWLYANAHRSRHCGSGPLVDLVDDSDARAGRADCRHRAHVLGSGGGGQRHSPGENGVYVSLRRGHAEGDAGQVCLVRDCSWAAERAWAWKGRRCRFAPE